MRLITAEMYEDLIPGLEGDVIGQHPLVIPLRSRAPIHANVGILIALAVDPTEYGNGMDLELKMVLPDRSGTVILGSTREQVPPRPRWQRGWQFFNQPFPTPGRYEFRYAIDGADVATVPLVVELLP